MNIINDVLVDKLFKDPPKRTKEIPLLSEKTASGDGMVVINDAYSDFPITNLTLRGNTEQPSTTGAQLFDANKMNGLTKSGVTVSVKDGMITATGMATKDEWIQAYVSVEEYKKIFKPGEKIFIKSYKTTDCNYDFGLYGAHGSPILGTATEGNSQPNGILLPTIYPARDTDFYFFVSVKQGVTLKGSLQPMVYQMGNGTYEPYTGGKPSPSPEYPQEIKSVGKWNEEKQKYEVEVRVTGNNILNMQIEPDTKGTYQGWKVGDGKKKITLSIIDKGNNKDISGCYFGLSGNGTNQEDGVAWLIESGKITKTKTTSLNPYVTIFPSDETAQRKILERFDIQCEFGEIQTEYQPYKEQTLTITSDRLITKWDKLVEQDGQIGWLFNRKIDVMPKTGWVLHPYGYFYKGNIFMDSAINLAPIDENNLFTHFKLGNPSSIKDKDTAWMYVHTVGKTNLRIRIADETINTVEALEKYIADKDMKIMYELAVPEFHPLPQSEQDVIRALLTYYPTTVITVDGGELPVGIEVTYMHPEYIPTKQSALRMWFKENPII